MERVAATVGTLRASGVDGRDVVLVDDVVTTGRDDGRGRPCRAGSGRAGGRACVAVASVDD